MELLGILRGASNYTFLARLEPHPPSGLNVVYKPARGESPLWDFPSGLGRREVAAYLLSGPERKARELRKRKAVNPYLTP